MEISFDFQGISYIEGSHVYPVKEDSLAVIRTIEDMQLPNEGAIMDMGSGTGLLSLFMAKKGWDVVSVDREPSALINLRKNLEMNDLESTLLLSDLFDGVPRSYTGMFDLIVFNPPYIQNDEGQLTRREGLALFGGEEGWEICRRFIEGSREFLKSDGSLVVLVYDSWDLEMLFFSMDLEMTKTIEFDINGESFKILVLSIFGK